MFAFVCPAQPALSQAASPARPGAEDSQLLIAPTLAREGLCGLWGAAIWAWGHSKEGLGCPKIEESDYPLLLSPR